MKFIFVSDLHFAVKLPHAKVNGSATSSDRLDDVTDVFNMIIDYVVRHSIDGVFILGDVFDKAAPDMATLRCVGEHLTELAVHTKVWLLPGNHDAHDRAGKLYTLDLFRVLDIPNVIVMNTVRTLRFGDVTFWALPWVPDRKVAGIIDGFNFAKGQLNVVLMHQTVDGCLDGGRRLSSPLSSSVFDRFDLALSGHIHKPQECGNVQYLGAPMQHRFGESNDPRGFWTLDSDTLVLELVPIVTSPLFLTVDFEANKAPGKEVQQFFDSIPATIRKRPVYLHFRIKGPSEGVEALSNLIDDFKTAFLSVSSKLAIRAWRKTKIVTDDGASARVRAAATSGGVATPEQLIEAFVTPYPGLPAGVTAEHLQRLGNAAMKASSK